MSGYGRTRSGRWRYIWCRISGGRVRRVMGMWAPQSTWGADVAMGERAKSSTYCTSSGSMVGSSGRLEGTDTGEEGGDVETLPSHDDKAQSLSSGKGSVRQPSSTSTSMSWCSSPRRAILVGNSCDEGVLGDGSCVAERLDEVRPVVW